MWTIVGELETIKVEGADEPMLTPADVESVTGWAHKPQGWCREDECIPHMADSGSDGLWELGELSAALGIEVATEPAASIAVLGTRPVSSSTIASGIAPDPELATLDGGTQRVFDQSDGRTMVVAFSSWCGCRYDLPGWQELQNELSDTGFSVVAVAIDESTKDVEEWAKGIDYPVLVDTNRDFADAYGLVNVPAVIWTDENRNVVRSPSAEFSSDLFTEVHGVESGPHLEAIKKWATTGEVPDSESESRPKPASVLSTRQLRARAEFRLGQELYRREQFELANRHLQLADELAPDDFTIWRAGMKLRGEDTFGAEFFDRYTDWQERTGSKP